MPRMTDDEARNKIVEEAKKALNLFGWGAGPVAPDKTSQRIAAAICADDKDTARPRQGGRFLYEIMELAGGGRKYLPRCLTITPEAVRKWQEQSADATAWRNNNDLPAWCGIFCYYIYRKAGIDLGGWASHKANILGDKEQPKKFRRITDPKEAFPGCIGNEDGVRAGGRNHHFIVIGNSGDTIESIDGNAFGPVDGQYNTGLKSVIAKKTYKHDRLKKASGYFLFPEPAVL